MSNQKINVTIDQAQMGSDEAWACSGRYCELLAAALESEFPDADISVSEETSTYNGGRDCVDGFADDDAVLMTVKHISEQVFTDGKWIA